MSSHPTAPRDKALKVNLDPRFYGTFAEIGAGQEVVRCFFLAGAWPLRLRLMPARHALLGFLTTLALAAVSGPARADDVIFNIGGGSQPGSEQRNETWGVDYSFHRFERSERQHIEIGVSYTSLKTNDPGNNSLVALSVYPQITLYPGKASKIAARSPAWAQPFFFVRALAPSYISENSLGTRQQAEHFAFQAQVGVGAVINTRGIVTVSWKHFSNANLFDENDGFDVPFVISGGIRF